MKKRTLFLDRSCFWHLFFYLFFPACNSSSTPSDKNTDPLKGKITISGAFALYPLTVKWAQEFQKIHPKVTINISAGGAGKGMADALSKMVDLGMYSKEVSPEEKAKGAWYIAVAKDAVLPTISSANPVIKDLKIHGLTKQKFFDIFISGKIKTWGEVTGTVQTWNLNRLPVPMHVVQQKCGQNSSRVRSRKISRGLASMEILVLPMPSEKCK